MPVMRYEWWYCSPTYIWLFGDIFGCQNIFGWEVLLTSRPQDLEVGTLSSENRAAPQVYKVMFPSILG
jgi:hypothetical protein